MVLFDCCAICNLELFCCQSVDTDVHAHRILHTHAHFSLQVSEVNPRANIKYQISVEKAPETKPHKANSAAKVPPQGPEGEGGPTGAGARGAVPRGGG